MTRAVTDDPTSYNFPQIEALGPDKIDNLGRALLSMTRELCVLTDRQMVLERLLENAGVVTGAAIEKHQPDEALQAAIDERMSAIIKSVISEFIDE